MDLEKKRNDARRLIELTRAYDLSVDQKNVSAEHRELFLKHAEQRRTLAIELYVKYFSDEQLQAQLDFYGTPLGKAILDSHDRIKQDYNSGLVEIANSMRGDQPDPVILREVMRDAGLEKKK